MKLAIKLVALVCVIAIVSAFIGYSIAQSSNTFYITSGIYPGAPSYSVYLVGVTYVAKNAFGYPAQSSTNATALILSLDALLATNGGIIYLYGFPLPSGVTPSEKVIILENYGGGYQGYGNINFGTRKPFFTDEGFYPGGAQPIAVSYNGKTYVVYQAGETQAAMITYYDETRHYWATPVKVGDNPLAGTDSHAAPALIIDKLGYIHVFWGSHSDAGEAKHSRSTNIGDISSWTAKAEMPPEESATYPKLVKDVSGNIYYFYRDSAGASWTTLDFVKSTDNGETWSGETTIADFGDLHSLYAGDFEYYDGAADQVHFAWNVYDYGTSKRLNVYHAYLNLSNVHLYNEAGSDLGTSISHAEADANCIVFNSGANEAAMPTVHLTSVGTPYILFGDVANHKWKFSVWNGAAWDTNDIFNSDIIFSIQKGDFIINSASIEAYVHIIRNDTYLARYGNDLMKFTSTNDGVNWTATESIYQNPDMWYIVGAYAVENHNDNLKIVFCPEYMFYQILDVEDFGMNYKFYGYGDNGLIYRNYRED